MVERGKEGKWAIGLRGINLLNVGIAAIGISCLNQSFLVFHENYVMCLASYIFMQKKF